MSGALPSSAPALIALALDRRRQAGLAPPVFASLDNLLDNGTVLRARVLDEAERIDGALAAWIARDVRFPSSVVDRMVPAPTEAVLEEIAGELGLTDKAAVAAERHRSWIIRSVEGLGPFADVGVELVDDVAPFERRKLWLLNGPHSAVAYGGLLAGHATIADAVTDPVIARFVRDIVAGHARGGPVPLRIAAGGIRRRRVAAIRQPRARPHLRAGRGRRIRQVAPAAAPRRRRPRGEVARDRAVRPRGRHLAGGGRRGRRARRAPSSPGGSACGPLPSCGGPSRRPAGTQPGRAR